MFVVRLIGVLALVALNGFFAATEFSLVAVRLSRIRQLVARGSIRARVVETLLGDLHRVVSGVQFGITLTSLAIGALGEATLASAFQTLWSGKPGTYTVFLAHSIALTCALDRKSTRLNSSHSQISYAVFCLKKKKQYTAYFCNL